MIQIHLTFSRNRQFYGKTLVEGILAPGETVYMPHFTPHIVYNLDETVAVSDNPYFATALEESAFHLHRREIVQFARIHKLHGVQINKGM